MKYLYLVICILFVSVSSGFCSDKELPLKWQPANNVRESGYVDVKNLGKIKIWVDPVIDSRREKNEIGRNTEKKTDRLYLTNDNVAQWATERFRYVLKEFGLNVTSDKPDVIISAELVKFYVIEENLYRGNVTFKVKAIKPDNTVLWEGITSGECNRWGRSFEEDNFYECIGNSFIEAIYNLLKDDSFIKSF
ncbi:MAG: hypothetical protein A2X59_07930 [Nitrospirae bacterium GWC2_42_7]|nr:MAG: hypothetical protein A2X59_07930 [Nitrospirae bacterium GWC2_42_7]